MTVRDKTRLRFRKAGDLRLVSHHDLMRCVERMLRRAALPYSQTSGFNPKPRLVFALSLALGVVGTDEVVELGLTEPLDPADVLDRLQREAPAGLEFTAAKRIAPNVTGRAIRAVYSFPVPHDRADLATDRAAGLLAAAEYFVDRTRPTRKRVDLRPYIEDVRASPGAVAFTLRVTPTGTARADEILSFLGIADLLDAGAVLSREKLELDDESPGAPAAPVSDGPVSDDVESDQTVSVDAVADEAVPGEFTRHGAVDV